jgi:hypothetical protein
MTCRKTSDDIETGAWSGPREEPGGNLLTAQAVSGMKAARAWSRLRCGTWEPVAPRRLPAPPAARGRPPSSTNCKGRVPGGTGADRPVVARKPGNAGGAKGCGLSGLAQRSTVL